MKAPRVNVVCKLLRVKLNERKAAGLDSIPSELLKMVGNIVAPSSLTQIFTESISTVIFQVEMARAGSLFSKKNGRPKQLSANIYHSDSSKNVRKSYLKQAVRVFY